MNDLVESLRRLSGIRVPDSLYSVAADEIERLEKELAIFNDAVEHCTDPNYTKRSTSSSDGWTMISSEFYFDLMVAYDEAADLETKLAESQARETKLRDAIDREMVASHLGVFNKDDDPVKAINALMSWANDVGEYFIKEQLAESQARAAKLRATLEAGALYDFMGWLTTRPERLTLSSADDAAPAAEAVNDFLTMLELRRMTEKRDGNCTN